MWPGHKAPLKTAAHVVGHTITIEAMSLEETTGDCYVVRTKMHTICTSATVTLWRYGDDSFYGTRQIYLLPVDVNPLQRIAPLYHVFVDIVLDKLKGVNLCIDTGIFPITIANMIVTTSCSTETANKRCSITDIGAISSNRHPSFDIREKALLDVCQERSS